VELSVGPMNNAVHRQSDNSFMEFRAQQSPVGNEFKFLHSGGCTDLEQHFSVIPNSLDAFVGFCLYFEVAPPPVHLHYF